MIHSIRSCRKPLSFQMKYQNERAITLKNNLLSYQHPLAMSWAHLIKNWVIVFGGVGLLDNVFLLPMSHILQISIIPLVLPDSAFPELIIWCENILSNLIHGVTWHLICSSLSHLSKMPIIMLLRSVNTRQLTMASAFATDDTYCSAGRGWLSHKS